MDLQRWSDRVHQSMHQNHPVFTRMVGGGLRWFFGLSTHPAFAVVLALLLVGFVISGVVTVIVSLSVFFAWLVTILWIAHSEPIKKLNILPRVTLMLLVGIAAGIIANLYVKWCLKNFAIHQPVPSATVAPTSDQALYQRLSDLLHQEIYRVESERRNETNAVSARAGKTIPPESPDIRLKIVGTKRFDIVIENASNTLLREPKYWVAMFNLTKSKPNQIVTVPITTFLGD